MGGSPTNKQVEPAPINLTESAKSPIIKSGERMEFLIALSEIMEQHEKITRQAWPVNTYVALENKVLSIFTGGELHSWIISEEDLRADDWVIV